MKEGLPVFPKFGRKVRLEAPKIFERDDIAFLEEPSICAGSRDLERRGDADNGEKAKDTV
jgi:hypothetical protein